MWFIHYLEYVAILDFHSLVKTPRKTVIVHLTKKKTMFKHL